MRFPKRAAAAAVILVLAAVLSRYALTGILSSPETYARSIEYLDEKSALATELSASAAGVAVLISCIPDDIGTPIADKVADLATDFIIVLSALTAEKYLLTLSGYVVFAWLLPIALLMGAVNLFVGSRWIWTAAVKLTALGISLVLLVPTSVALSRVIDDTYHASIQSTVDSARELAEDLNGELQAEAESETAAGEIAEEGESKRDEAGENAGLVDQLGSLVGGARDAVTEKASELVEGASNLVRGTADTIRSIPELPAKASELLHRFTEALVVMIVTTCIIPILTMFVLLWIVNNILGSNLELPRKPHVRRRQYHHGDEDESLR